MERWLKMVTLVTDISKQWFKQCSGLFIYLYFHDKKFGGRWFPALEYQCKDTTDSSGISLEVKCGCLNNHAYILSFRKEKRQKTNGTSKLGLSALHHPTSLI